MGGHHVSRRRFLTASGATAGVVAAGAAGFTLGHAAAPASSEPAAQGVEPFYGPHQAGIATAQQDRLFFAAYDLTTTSLADLRELLEAWTAAAADMAAGRPAGPDAPNESAPPTDTGEAVGLDPAHLTITFGFGPTLFDADGDDRFGLADRRPAALADLPAFPGDALDPAQGGGDLCVQACSNDPQVAYHAARNLTRIARGTAVLRWTQQGFGRTSSTTSSQVTPRNLMGFKDGTNNLDADEPDVDSMVWAAPEDGSDWMAGGSYLVARRIRMHIEVWDRSSLLDQEQTFGRTKAEGAPLGAAHERDPVDLDATGPDGAPVIPVGAHIRLASRARHGTPILRRGYSFTDGVVPATGQLDAGLFFVAYQRDPRAQFVPLQQRLAAGDALNEYVQHVGSALFAVPPGVAGPGHWIGETLLG